MANPYCQPPTCLPVIAGRANETHNGTIVAATAGVCKRRGFLPATDNQGELPA
jgi:hypothetical protein